MMGLWNLVGQFLRCISVTEFSIFDAFKEEDYWIENADIFAYFVSEVEEEIIKTTEKLIKKK
jgi:hypothetical protein